MEGTLDAGKKKIENSHRNFVKQQKILSQFLAGVILGCIPLTASAQAPQWWTDLSVTNGNFANDYAAVNQGQVKNIALKAIAELDADLPGGAGDILTSLATNLSGTTANTNDYAAVNLGQLKAVAKPIFDRLLEVQYNGHPLESGTYPWVGKESSSNDYAMTNIGQVKNLFSFDLTVTGTNGLPDWWQNFYFGGTVPDPNTLAPRGDGLTILQAYQQGVNPFDFYNGLAPYMYIVDGNGQTGTTGAFVPTPLSVCVLDGTTWEGLPNTPVAFVVRQGGGGLSVTGTAGSTTSGTLQVLTDSYGYAQAYYQEPAGIPIASIIGVPSGKASSLIFVSYNGTTTVGEWKFDEGTGLVTADSSGSGVSGTLYNTTWTTRFDTSAALQFSGTNSYVEMPDSRTFNIGIGPMTVMAWVRPTVGMSLNADTDTYNIAYKGTSSGTGFQFALAGGTNNGLITRIFNGGTSQIVTPSSNQITTLTDGNWHHIVFERDETGKATLYIDGTAVGNQTGMNGNVDFGTPLWIAKGEGSGFFIGAVDDVILWRTVANSDQIATIYNYDSDGNQLYDWWEVKYYGSIGQDPNALTQRGDGTTLLQACQQGDNPFDFYNGVPPTLTIVSGGDQRGNPGAMLSNPLAVTINSGTYNAPITFTVTSGGALISATSGDVSTASTSVTTRSTNLYTNSSGNTQNVAQVYIYVPETSSDLSVITATATSGTQSVSIVTTASAIDTTLSTPTNLTATPTSSSSVDLAWTPSDSAQPTTIQASTDGGATWANVVVVMAGINSLTITDITSDIQVSFRAITGNCAGSDPISDTLVSMPSQSNYLSATGGGSSSSSEAQSKSRSSPILLAANGYSTNETSSSAKKPSPLGPFSEVAIATAWDENWDGWYDNLFLSYKFQGNNGDCVTWVEEWANSQTSSPKYIVKTGTLIGAESQTFQMDLYSSGYENTLFQIFLLRPYLTQLNYPSTKDTTDLGATISQQFIVNGTGSNSIAYITGSPEMPQLQISLLHSPTSDLTVEWRMHITSERPERGNNDDLDIPATSDGGIRVIELPISQPWCINDYFYTLADFFGGNCSIFYRIKDANGTYVTDEMEYKFVIRGKNPMDTNAFTYIKSNSGNYYYAWAICQEESRQKQRIYNGFNSGGDGSSRLEQPNFTKPDGWGIAQLDKPLGVTCSTREVYDWHANISKFNLELDEKRDRAIDVIDWIRNKFGHRADWEEPPTSYYISMSYFSAYDLATIVLYNGTAGCPVFDVIDDYGKTQTVQFPWTYDPDRKPKWQFTDNTNPVSHEHYATKVIQDEWEGGVGHVE